MSAWRIRLGCHVAAELWSRWCPGVQVCNEPDGTALVTTPPLDQPALHGLLARVRDRNIPLLALEADPRSES